MRLARLASDDIVPEERDVDDVRYGDASRYILAVRALIGGDAASQRGRWSTMPPEASHDATVLVRATATKGMFRKVRPPEELEATDDQPDGSSSGASPRS